MKAIFPIFLALALTAGAADFFGVPDKTVVPKPVPATPAPAVSGPAAATPTPATPDPTTPARDPKLPTAIVAGPTNDEPPTLLPDGAFLKTLTVGGEKGLGTAFHDLGPDRGVLIGFEYTTSVTEAGTMAIQSMTPLYVRAAGKARGVLRGKPKPGNPATVLEARPGFAVAAVEARGSSFLEGFQVTFVRYENGALDRSEQYTSKWIGGESKLPLKRLFTDTRPIVGIYGRGTPDLNEFGLIVRKEVPPAPKNVAGGFFGTALPPGTSVPPTPGTVMPEDVPGTPEGEPLEPTAFDPAILKTPVVGGDNKKWGTPFRDLAPPSAFLTGFDYTVGPWNDKSAITSMRPLYALANGSAKRLGDLHGAPTGQPQRVEARPTYAVGTIVARGGALIDGFQIVFMKVRGDSLNPADSYLSEWFGGTGGGQKRLNGTGQPIVGIYGSSGREVNSLGLFVKKVGGPGLASVPSSLPNLLATPVPVPTAGGVEVFAVADDSFTLFHNGREILAGTNLRQVESGTFPIVKGDVLTAIVKDEGGGGGQAWFSLRVVRDGKTILDAGDMRYLLSETLNWKTNKLMTGFREPKVWTHEKSMGTDARPRAAWAGAKDATATTLYFKGLVP